MFNNNYSFPQGSGYQFMGGPQMPTKINNFLSNEEIQKLIQKENQFSLQLTETEVLRGKCNHRSADGLRDTIVEDPITGVSRCTICGYEFRPLDIQTSPEQIQESCDTILDILQTIKLIFVGMPIEAAEFFQLIPLIEKIPKLFEYAVKDYAKHERVDQYMYNNRNMSTMNLFNMLCGTINQQPFNTQPVDPNAAAQQQPYGFAAQAPMGAAAPQFNPYMGMGMPMSNGFGYMGGGYTPQTTGYQFPGQPAPAPAAAPADAAPAATTEATATFKA